MSRYFRPPLPLRVRTTPDGQPTGVVRNGYYRRVTAVMATWERQAAWWTDAALTEQAPAWDREERAYYRLLLDDILCIEVFHLPSGGWYLERVRD